MVNLFDQNNALTTEPTSVIIGTLVQWKRADLSDIYAPASYDLIYNIRLRNGDGVDKVVTATTATDGSFLVTLNANVTSAMVAGDYVWQAFISRKSDGAKVSVSQGNITLLSNLDQNGADNRSHAQIMVEKIQSLLEGKADKDVSSYSIQGRSLAKMSVADLLNWRDYYRREVVKEKQDALIAAGKPSNATVKVRFR
jgi:hypothetical protein